MEESGALAYRLGHWFMLGKFSHTAQTHLPASVVTHSGLFPPVSRQRAPGNVIWVTPLLWPQDSLKPVILFSKLLWY